MRLLKLSILINYLSLTKNIKKAVTAIHIGIFLSIFAASSAIISLYIENEISDLEYELASWSESKRYQERASAKLPRLVSDFHRYMDIDKIYRDFTQTLKLTNFWNRVISHEDRYIPFYYDIDEVLELEDSMTGEEIAGLKDLINKYPEYTKKKYLQIIDDFPKIFKTIIPNDEIEKYRSILFDSSYQNLLDEINNYENQLMFEGKLYQYYEDTYKIYDFAIEFINMIDSLSLYMIEIHEQTIDELNDAIIKKSLFEKNLVLTIFVLQFLIFLIVQFFELSSVSLNSKIKKLIK
tara:strand:- start:980 stop:1861 length:882 start_codon:yes stop_codon:yes gene_type:complete